MSKFKDELLRLEYLKIEYESYLKKISCNVVKIAYNKNQLPHEKFTIAEYNMMEDKFIANVKSLEEGFQIQIPLEELEGSVDINNKIVKIEE